MADTIYDTYFQLDCTLHRIKSLLHGTISSMDFFADKDAEIDMIAAAKDLAEEAKELADCLYQACSKERKALSSRTG